MQSIIRSMCNAGLYLVPIPAIDGNPTKGPKAKGWNKPRSQNNPAGYSNRYESFSHLGGCNFGIYHKASQTLALDLDDLSTAATLFKEIANTNIQDWFTDPDRAEIESPKKNRAKLLFKLPAEIDYAQVRQVKQKRNMIFELRAGSCQDVIAGQHPEGGEYRFIGDPEKIPQAPDILLNMLKYWEDWKCCFESAMSTEASMPDTSPRKQQNNNPAGWRNPITEFNKTKPVKDVLLANGYKPAGENRYIRPGSQSGAPGLAILSDFQDGLDRAYSHGGDALNDGYAHDAFDCFKILQCDGDLNKALAWNNEITKHNQQLFRQDESKRNARQSTAEKPPTKLPDGTVLESSDIRVLQKLNETYVHTVLGSKNIIIGQRHCQVQGSMLTFEPLQEFKKKFLHEPRVTTNKKNQGQVWLEWPGKKFMPNGAGFYPDQKKCPPGTFNLFRGYQVSPIGGDCSPYLNHLKNIICAGDKTAFAYLIGWLAHLFQKPDVKPSIAVVLKSSEGTGKGTMADPILKILGYHGNKTNGAYAIASRFNSTLANKLFIFADEVDLTDKHVADRLKGIISETTVNLERKGLEIEPLPNYCRLMFASNHAQVLNAGIRERRYLVLEPSDEKIQDPDYFDSLWAWINAKDSPAKLLNYLLHVDISGFDPYRCPQTKALITEKLSNLCDINRFLYNEIIRDEPFEGVSSIKASDLVDKFVSWSIDEGHRISLASARSQVGKIMVKLHIEVKGRSDRGCGKFYEIPNRDVLVQEFASFLNIPVTSLGL